MTCGRFGANAAWLRLAVLAYNVLRALKRLALPPELLSAKRFFRDLTQNRLRRGVFRDGEELIMAIGDYIGRHNQHPKRFIWTAKASDILQKVKRTRRSLNIVRSV